MKKLALLDLEGTLIDFEFWEEMADVKGDQSLKLLLEKGLRGPGWYESFLDRVRLILGTPKEVVESVAKRAIGKIRPEAVTLISELKKRQYVTMIVSGGFEEFVAPVAHALGVDDYVSQKLIYHNGVIVGVLPVFKEKGEVVDKLRPWFDFVLAVGDGYNDIKMLERADEAVVVGKRAKEISKKINAKTYNNLGEFVEDLIKGGDAIKI
ncbi:HAD family hydrolase [Ignicoccus hospitalis]|uniref:phosphoserine phosphatase n=1 Tax=Ignicoccus hospitalis (strain KIN4/I / DSM 18386 / JCM 14125) TaxID=453591 RepID=A8A924_IGNH4|nr:HAD family phosphatase [Ignicoccus hospitalis]ABU81426.1 HAD-superfamily hydrolase, subfamily IB (PSPase-like) [Ignicoccus hospitalis KIN4/I]HIH90267.1 HAD-IB family phosphatase [Desulfurococcaceae archaeon]